jgi:hypothetical protein
MENMCYLRFFQASLNAPALDIYINDVALVKDFAYKDFTKYFKAVSGSYNIKIFVSGNKNLIVLDENIELYPNNIYTLAIIGLFNLNGIEINLIDDHLRDINKNYSYIRFINLSPSSRDLDIVLNNNLAISELSYATVSSYLELPPGRYNFKAYLSSQQKLVLENPNMTLDPGKIYSGYVLGIENIKDSMQIVIPLEGATYLKF